VALRARRRQLLLWGAASAAFGVAKVGLAEDTTAEAIAACEQFTGSTFTPAERQQMLAQVDAQLERLRLLQSQRYENELAPAELFDPRLPGFALRAPAGEAAKPARPAPLPGSEEAIAYASASEQSTWIRSGQLRSRDLVRIYLERIAKHDPALHAFVTVTAETAQAQAAAADEELARGEWRGPLHGLPYGLKDLIDTRGIATTWGAGPYSDRVPESDAVVVERLRRAGAVLLGKTSAGALAYGDIWFRARTRNPYNLEEGSSGSSAGSAAAVAAGLCSFAIGTETMGSIVSPAARCGAVGLRPSFGRVPRTGAMALCWSLDKVGALTREPRDALEVVRALSGADAGDPASFDVALPDLPELDPGSVRLGYRREWFEEGLPTDRAFLLAARAAGFGLREVKLPELDVAALAGIVVLEAAAAFERLTLEDEDDELRWQDDIAWPNTWRAARFEPAIGYIQAQRLRRRLMQEFARSMADVDALIHPNFAADLLAIGNHTGYPALVVPAGLLPQPVRPGFETYVEPAVGATTRAVPFTASLTGHLFDEPRLVAIGARIARELGFRPPPPL